MNYYISKSGLYVPKVAIGTWKLIERDCYEAVSNALSVGYRHIDTADSYSNHTFVSSAIKSTNIPRGDIFITTKIKHDRLEKDSIMQDIPRFLKELETDYIDLVMVHWPNRHVPIRETLDTLLYFKKNKIIRFIGVSNFTKHHIQDILNAYNGSKIIDFNQVEFHPTLNQRDLLEFCQKNGITVSAYSPLGMGEELEIPIIKDLSDKYSKTPSQIILNWLLSKEMVVIPKSRSKVHLQENLDSLNFHISRSDNILLESLDRNNRLLRKDIDEFDY